MNKFSIFATAALLSVTLIPETGSAQLFARLGARHYCPTQQCCPPSCFQPSGCYQQPMVYQHHVGPACGCQPMHGCPQYGVPSCGCSSWQHIEGEQEIQDCINNHCGNCGGIIGQRACKRICQLLYDDDPTTNPLFYLDCYTGPRHVPEMCGCRPSCQCYSPRFRLFGR